MKNFPGIFKILLSVSFFIVIPTLIMIYFISNQSLTYFESEMQKTAISNLQLVKENNENSINSIIQSTIKMSMNPMIDKIENINNYEDIKDNTDNVIDINDIISLLRNETYGDTNIYSMYLYKDNTNYLLTTQNGPVRLNDYHDKEWLEAYKSFTKSNEKELCYSRRLPCDPTISNSSDIINNSAPDDNENNNSTVPIDVDSNSTVNVVTYLYKLTPITTNISGVIVINIYEDSISKLINQFYKNGTINYIVNKNGLVISNVNKSSVATSISNEEYFKNILSNSGQNGYIISKTSEGKKNIYTYNKSDFSDWIYISSQPLGQLTSNLNELSSRWVFASNLIVIIGLALMAIVIYKIYSPIRQIIREVVDIDNLKQIGSKDEYIIISRAFKRITEQQHIMKEQLKNRKTQVKELYLLDLLRGDIEKYIDKDKPDDINFVYDNYIVAVLAFDDNFSEYSSEQRLYLRLSLMKCIQQEIGDRYINYSVVYDGISVATIINFNDDEENNIYKNLITIFESTKNHMLEDIEQSISVGIGKKYNSQDMIKSSATQAVSALSRRMLRGKESTILWDTKMEVTGKYYYPYDIEKKILNGIATNNIATIEYELEILIKKLKKMEELTSYNVLHIYNQLISATLKYLSDSNDNINDIVGNVNHIYMQLSSKAVIEEINELMVNFYRKVCKFKSINISRESYFDKIVSYLKENFHHEINFEDMAKEMGISYSYVRKIIKQVTNKTLLEYVTDLRLEEAKRLLRQSDLNISQISELIGFSNVQCFNRFFKKCEGVTANEFRKNSTVLN